MKRIINLKKFNVHYSNIAKKYVAVEGITDRCTIKIRDVNYEKVFAFKGEGEFDWRTSKLLVSMIIKSENLSRRFFKYRKKIVDMNLRYKNLLSETT